MLIVAPSSQPGTLPNPSAKTTQTPASNWNQWCASLCHIARTCRVLASSNVASQLRVSPPATATATSPAQSWQQMMRKKCQPPACRASKKSVNVLPIYEREKKEEREKLQQNMISEEFSILKWIRFNRVARLNCTRDYIRFLESVSEIKLRYYIFIHIYGLEMGE